MSLEVVPKGITTTAQPGDFMLTRRKGFVHKMIVWGERLRFRGAYWSHAAFFVEPGKVVEALGGGVKYTSISEYRDLEYVVVHTNLNPLDMEQACRFARSCVGQNYGFLTILGLAFRLLTPGRGLWFGMNGTEICSGLVASCLCRGWYNFPVDPGTMTPAELATFFKVGKGGKKA